MDITFNGVTMKTPVYIKMDAPVQLLLGRSVQTTEHSFISSHCDWRNECNTETETGARPIESPGYQDANPGNWWRGNNTH